MDERDNPAIAQFGKSMSDILMIKQDFFKKNDALLERNNDIAKAYTTRPRRTRCKLCNAVLPQECYFTSHGIAYHKCACGHINGSNMDDKAFSDAIYLSPEYGETYRESDERAYIERVDSIYIPKVRFLVNTMKSFNIPFEAFRFLDVGAGSGYMVSALKRSGLEATGVEVSESQVAYGNAALGTRLLTRIDPDAVSEAISSSDCEVLSFIGVLEHIEGLRDVLEAIRCNKRIEYIYFSVPMLSLSCIIESSFPNVFNRHLGGGHTHLFSRDSLEWMYANYGFSAIAHWDFGQDIIELYRSLVVSLEQNGAHQELINHIHQLFRENADMMQLIIDKAFFASETHVLARVRH